MDSSQIFQTDNAARWRRFKWTGRFVLFVMLFFIAVAVLAVINARNPTLPNMAQRAKSYQEKLDPTNKLTLANAENKKYKGFKDFLVRKEQEDSIKHIQENSSRSSLIRAGFYTPWNPASLADLRKNADKLNTVYPEWFFIDTLTYQLQTRIDTAGLTVIKQNKLSIQPIFNNYRSAKTKGGAAFFDSKLLHVILNDAEKRTFIIQQLVDTLK